MKSYSTAFAFRRTLEDRLHAASEAEDVDLQRAIHDWRFMRMPFYRITGLSLALGCRRWWNIDSLASALNPS